MATSTVDEAVDLQGQPFDCFGQLENLGRELLDKGRLRRWVIPRAVQLADGLSNLVRNPDNRDAQGAYDGVGSAAGSRPPTGRWATPNDPRS